MKFSPVVLILFVLVLLFVFGGMRYNSGAYANYGYGGGGLLFIIIVLLLLGII